MNQVFSSDQLKSRILKSLGANAYGQIIAVGIQIISIPLFLHFWGVAKYGEWLILSAIPAYLSMSDIGFASVAGNRMTMLNAENKREEVVRVYQSGWKLISSISLVSTVVIVFVVFLVNPSELLKIKKISDSDVQIVLLLLAMQVIIILQGGLLSAGFRAIGKNALGIMFSNTIRLMEWMSAAIVMGLQYGPVAVAMTFLICRIIGTAITWLVLDKLASWLKVGFSHSNKGIIRELLKPAIAFMAFPLGLALSLQGALLVIGALLGPVSVVIFSTYRTLSRLLIQAITIVNQATWPEISAAYGTKNYSLARRLHRKGFSLAFWLGLIGVFVVGLLGEWFVGIWTQNKLPSQPVLLWILLVVSYINILWQSSWVLLMATNKHVQTAKIFLVTNVFSLVFIAVIASEFGIEWAAASLIFAELPMLIWAIKSGIVLVSDSKKEFILAPFQMLIKRR